MLPLGFRVASAYIAAMVAMLVASSIARSQAPAIFPYVMAMSIGAMIVSLALWKAAECRWTGIFGGALLLHLVALAGVPVFEDDYFRFIWDGWQIGTFGTAYGVPPEDFFGDSRVPDALNEILSGVNNPDVPTIYGPVLELLFAVVYASAGTDLLGLRLAFTLTNMALIGLMLCRYPAERVALYAWNPMVVCEIALHVHPDVVMVLLLFAGVMILKRRPAVAGMVFGLAAGVKLVALALWPLLLRTRPQALLAAAMTLVLSYVIFFVQGQGVGFDSTAIFATRWLFNPLGYQPLDALLPSNVARLATALLAGVGVLWLHAGSAGRIDSSIAAIFGLILFWAPAVNAWYLLWLLPFAVAGRQLWPFAATAALPFSYLTGLNLGDVNMRPFQVHWAARLAEVSLLCFAVAWDIWRARPKESGLSKLPVIENPRTAIIIPALNEESSVAGVVSGLAHAGIAGLRQIIVVDNGSTDGTANAAREAGAVVVSEQERGYGAACLAGIAAVPADISILLFADADASDVPQDAARLVAAVARGEAALVIGSRKLGQIELGAMSWPQRFGNWLAPALIRMIWGARFTDLGPLRAIRRDALAQLKMQDRNFGWTIEMQVRAAKCGMVCAELPAGYRKRIGVSKISGTVSGVIGAGTKILFIIAREAFGDFGKSDQKAVVNELDQNRSSHTCVV